MTLTLMLLCSMGAKASPTPADSLRTLLPQAPTARDSLALLLDIYDLSPRAGRTQAAWDAYHTALTAGDTHAALDMLRGLTNLHLSNDSLITTYIAEAEAFQPSADRDETLCFMRLMRTQARARSLTPPALQDSLTCAIEAVENLTDTSGLLERIEAVYRFCLLLGYSTQGELLADTYSGLEQLIAQLPDYPGVLKSMYNVSAGIAYSSNAMHPQTVEAQRRVLATIAALERRYHSQGRRFRSYDETLYSALRTMLSAYPALTPAETADIYARTRRLCQTNPDVARADARNPRTRIYHLMATKQYAQAIPLIESYLASEQAEERHRLPMLRALRTAATATADRAALLSASDQYAALLETRLDQKVAERNRELQVMYQVNDLRRDRAQMQLQREAERLWRQRILVTAAIAVSIMLLVLMALVWRQYRKARTLTATLEATNKRLRKQRDTLDTARQNLSEALEKASEADRKKADFIHSMGHEIITPVNAIVEYSTLITDSIESDPRAYLHRFAEVVRLNSGILMGLVNTILDVAAIENSVMTLNRQPQDLRICARTAADSLSHAARPGVTLSVDTSAYPDALAVDTDTQRLSQIIYNLLDNALKFTLKGSVTLALRPCANGRMVEISDTDTGPGIPAAAAERIFERFEKLDRDSRGYGLGLYLSRLLATLLGGTLRLDTTHSRGTRMVLTLPVK